MPVAAAVDLQNGFPFDSADFSDTGTTPLLRIRDLTASEFETYLNLNVPEQYMVRAGDLVIGMDGDFNAIIWKRDPAALNQRVCRLRARKGHDLRYVGYSLPAELKRINETQFATTVKHLSSGEILSSRIPSKSLEEQRRIADFLDDRVARIDQIIAARQQQTMAAEEAIKAARDSLVFGGDQTEGHNSRGAVPLRRLRCLVQTGPFGSQLHADDYVDDGWPVVNPASLTAEGIRPIPGMSISEATRDRLSRHILRPGDIVFGRRGELGRAGLVEDENEGWLCGTGSLLLRLQDPRVLPEYMTALLQTTVAKHYFDSSSVGSTMDNLNTDILLAFPLRLVPLADQQRILAELRRLHTQGHSIRAGLDASVSLLQEYKQTLITAAVTGEFDVTTASTRIPE